MDGVEEQVQQLLLVRVLLIGGGGNTGLDHFFRFLSAVEEREVVVYEVGFAIFLRTLDLLFRISLSFFGLLGFLDLVEHRRQRVSSGDDQLLLGVQAGHLREPQVSGIEGRVNIKLLRRVSRLMTCVTVEALHLFGDEIGGEGRRLEEKIKRRHWLGILILYITLLFSLGLIYDSIIIAPPTPSQQLATHPILLPDLFPNSAAPTTHRDG